jgi:hypothetical protein
MRGRRGSLLVGAMLLAACGGVEKEETGATGSSSATGQGGASTSSMSSSSSSTGSTGGAAGDGNDSCETAEPFDFGGGIPRELSPTGDMDFFVFQGKKGDALRFGAEAQYLDDTPGEPNHLDTVVTLYDAMGNQLAQNDFAIPHGNDDGILLTMLPADGTYCLRVAECWTVVNNPAASCAAPKDKAFTSYELRPLELDPALDRVVSDAETGDDASSASANVLEYEQTNDGYYFTGYAYGTFRDASDIDVFSFKLPLDAPIEDGARANANTYLIPSGVDYDGSSVPIGKVWITTAADPMTVIAELDGASKYGIYFYVPLELGVEHLLFVSHPPTPAGSNDFYILRYAVGGGNAVESAGTANDTPDGADLLIDPSDLADGVTAYYLAGDIAPIGDLDHFRFPLAPGTTQVEVDCGGLNWGSGVLGLTTTIMQLDGTPLDTDQETVGDIAVAFAQVPVGPTELIALVSATGQSPAITSSFYRCGVYQAP